MGKGICGGLLLAALLLAGCSSFGSKKQEAALAEPNAYPATYRAQITAFLRRSLASRSDYRGAMIAPPVLKTVGDAQRYVVCVKFNPQSQIKPKVAIYFADMIAQFIDSTPEQCSDAAYQPFHELDAAMPAT